MRKLKHSERVRALQWRFQSSLCTQSDPDFLTDYPYGPIWIRASDIFVGTNGLAKTCLGESGGEGYLQSSVQTPIK